jgi:hypothetical protein
MSTAYKTANDIIKDRFLQNWTYTKIQFDGYNYLIDNVGAKSPITADVPYVYFKVIIPTFNQESIGSPGSQRHRLLGTIFMNVFVPVNTGNDAALQLIDHFTTLFKNKFFSGVHTTDITGGFYQVIEEGNWYGVPVACGFYFDEIG